MVDAVCIVGRGVYDLSVFKGKADVFILEALHHRRRVVGDDAVDAVPHGRGIDLAIRDVLFAIALHCADALDGKG